ncbi:MAG: PilZ domain-containing protein [Acidobacteriia bacterium]|nr:PilZ domain-containing protein [Terriglobia bacterium]
MPRKGSQFRERRRSERHIVRGVKGTLHLSANARIVNMSITGMAVETNAQMRVGRKYSITFRHADDATLRLAGSVVWCRMRDTSQTDGGAATPVYAAGFRFDQALGNRAADLARILQTDSPTEVSKRSSGRFKVDVPEPVNLYTACHFAVKNVSAVGILVETEEPPPLDTIVDAELRLREHILRTRGRVARIGEVTGARGEKLSQLGIEFIETSEAGREAIEQFVGRCIELAADEAAS